MRLFTAMQRSKIAAAWRAGITVQHVSVGLRVIKSATDPTVVRRLRRREMEAVDWKPIVLSRGKY